MAEGAPPSDGHCRRGFPSNLGQDNNAQEIQPTEALRDAHGREEDTLAMDRPPSSSTKSLSKAIQDDITLPRAAELTAGTAAASSSMESVGRVDPKTKENVNTASRRSSSTSKTVLDAPGSEEPTLAVGRSPSSSTKSHGKAIEAYDQEHAGVASSTKIISTAIADVGPSVRAPSQHHDEVVAVSRGPAQAANASDVASNAAPTIPTFAQRDVNVAIAAIGGGGGAAGARPAAGQPNAAPAIPALAQRDVNAAIGGGARLAARQVPAPAQINGGGNAVIVALPAPAQPNVARQVPAPAQINGGGNAVIVALPAPAQPNVARQVPAPARINGGGNAVIVAHAAPAQPNVARQVPAPARINGGGNAVIVALPAPAQPNAGWPAPPIPVLPPNRGVNYIDEALTISVIRPLQIPANGDEGKFWDKLN